MTLPELGWETAPGDPNAPDEAQRTDDRTRLIKFGRRFTALLKPGKARPQIQSLFGCPDGVRTYQARGTTRRWPSALPMLLKHEDMES